MRQGILLLLSLMICVGAISLIVASRCDTDPHVVMVGETSTQDDADDADQVEDQKSEQSEDHEEDHQKGSGDEEYNVDVIFEPLSYVVDEDGDKDWMDGIVKLDKDAFLALNGSGNWETILKNCGGCHGR